MADLRIHDLVVEYSSGGYALRPIDHLNLEAPAGSLTILLGRRNMPAFGAKHAIGFGGPAATLSEEQIAAVINYVRTNFGNHYTDSITAAEVVALEEKTR